jgi:uncharacterized membrane protein YfcA
MNISKKHEPLSSAKAIIGLLVLAIAFVLFSKFVSNQDALMQDPEALRNYVVFSIVVAGFLIGLLYLSSKTTHKVKAAPKAKAVKSKKKKK